jgi:hypothetical protein
MLVDLGKVVHYQFEKITHKNEPTQAESDEFYILRPSDKVYAVNHDIKNPAILRARTTWISADENKDSIEKEFKLESKPDKEFHSFGRSAGRDL